MSLPVVVVSTAKAKARSEAAATVLRKEAGWNSGAPMLERRIPKYDSRRDPNCRLAFGKGLGDPFFFQQAGSVAEWDDDGFESVSKAFDFVHHEGTDTGRELVVLRAILVRESIVSKLEVLAESLVRAARRAWLLGGAIYRPQSSSSSSSSSQEDSLLIADTEKKSAIEAMIALRTATVEVCEAIAEWRADVQEEQDEKRPFIWHGRNYLLKIAKSDVDFLAALDPLVALVGVEAAKMKRNPLMLPRTLEEAATDKDDESMMSDDDEEDESPERQQRREKRRLRQAEFLLVSEQQGGNNETPPARAPTIKKTRSQSSGPPSKEITTWLEEAQTQLRTLKASRSATTSFSTTLAQLGSPVEQQKSLSHTSQTLRAVASKSKKKKKKKKKTKARPTARAGQPYIDDYEEHHLVSSSPKKDGPPLFSGFPAVSTRTLEYDEEYEEEQSLPPFLYSSSSEAIMAAARAAAMVTAAELCSLQQATSQPPEHWALLGAACLTLLHAAPNSLPAEVSWQSFLRKAGVFHDDKHGGLLETIRAVQPAEVSLLKRKALKRLLQEVDKALLKKVVKHVDSEANRAARRLEAWVRAVHHAANSCSFAALNDAKSASAESELAQASLVKVKRRSRKKKSDVMMVVSPREDDEEEEQEISEEEVLCTTLRHLNGPHKNGDETPWLLTVLKGKAGCYECRAYHATSETHASVIVHTPPETDEWAATELPDAVELYTTHGELRLRLKKKQGGAPVEEEPPKVEVEPPSSTMMSPPGFKLGDIGSTFAAIDAGTEGYDALVEWVLPSALAEHCESSDFPERCLARFDLEVSRNAQLHEISNTKTSFARAKTTLPVEDAAAILSELSANPTIDTPKVQPHLAKMIIVAIEERRTTHHSMEIVLAERSEFVSLCKLCLALLTMREAEQKRLCTLQLQLRQSSCTGDLNGFLTRARLPFTVRPTREVQSAEFAHEAKAKYNAVLADMDSTTNVLKAGQLGRPLTELCAVPVTEEFLNELLAMLFFQKSQRSMTKAANLLRSQALDQKQFLQIARLACIAAPLKIATANLAIMREEQQHVDLPVAAVTTRRAQTPETKQVDRVLMKLKATYENAENYTTQVPTALVDQVCSGDFALEAHKRFDELDVDKEGFVKPTDLWPLICQICTNLDTVGAPSMSEKQHDDLLSFMDSDKDGMISFDEFLEFARFFLIASWADNQKNTTGDQQQKKLPQPRSSSSANGEEKPEPMIAQPSGSPARSRHPDGPRARPVIQSSGESNGGPDESSSNRRPRENKKMSSSKQRRESPHATKSLESPPSGLSGFVRKMDVDRVFGRLPPDISERLQSTAFNVECVSQFREHSHGHAVYGPDRVSKILLVMMRREEDLHGLNMPAPGRIPALEDASDYCAEFVTHVDGKRPTTEQDFYLICQSAISRLYLRQRDSSRVEDLLSEFKSRRGDFEAMLEALPDDVVDEIFIDSEDFVAECKTQFDALDTDKSGKLLPFSKLKPLLVTLSSAQHAADHHSDDLVAELELSVDSITNEQCEHFAAIFDADEEGFDLEKYTTFAQYLNVLEYTRNNNITAQKLTVKEELLDLNKDEVQGSGAVAVDYILEMLKEGKPRFDEALRLVPPTFIDFLASEQFETFCLERYDLMDVNSDGTLSTNELWPLVSEIAELWDVLGDAPLQPEQCVRFFATFDADADGVLNRTEFVALTRYILIFELLERTSKEDVPLEESMPPGESMRTDVDKIDSALKQLFESSNTDFEAAIGELPSFIQDELRSSKYREECSIEFNRLDVDANGMITFGELEPLMLGISGACSNQAIIPQHLERLSAAYDADKDGWITLDEFVQATKHLTVLRLLLELKQSQQAKDVAANRKAQFTTTPRNSLELTGAGSSNSRFAPKLRPRHSTAINR